MEEIIQPIKKGRKITANIKEDKEYHHLTIYYCRQRKG
jgi:hypothetical protein